MSAGTNWRILVHDSPEPGESMHGRAHDIRSGESDDEHRKILASLRLADRAKVGEDYLPPELRTRLEVLPGTEFDELVIGSWIHLEQMDNHLYWMSIGGVVVHVTTRSDGTPEQVTVHMPGNYDQPRTGCQYRLDDEDYEP